MFFKSKQVKKALSMLLVVLLLVPAIGGSAGAVTAPLIEWPNMGAVRTTFNVTKTAGDPADVYTVSAAVEGKPYEKSSDVVLVIDRSGSMSGTPMTNAKNAAKEFVYSILESNKEVKGAYSVLLIDRSRYVTNEAFAAEKAAAAEYVTKLLTNDDGTATGNKVAVITYDRYTSTLSGFSSDKSTLLTKINNLTKYTSGTTTNHSQPHLAINAAKALFTSSLNDTTAVDKNVYYGRSIVWMSANTPSSYYITQAQNAAEAAKSSLKSEVKLYTVGMNVTDDYQTVLDTVDSAGYYVARPETDHAQLVLGSVAEEIRAAYPAGVSVTDNKNRVAIDSYSQDATVSDFYSANLADRTSLVNIINAMNATGGTNIQAAIRAAHQLMAPAEPGLISNPAKKGRADNAALNLRYNRAIVLMSDGEPTYSYKLTSAQASVSFECHDSSWWGHVTDDVIVSDITDPVFDYTTRVGSGSSFSLYNSQKLSLTLTGPDNMGYTHTETVQIPEDNGFGTIAEAGFAKKTGTNYQTTIYSVGLNIGTNGQEVLTSCADTNKYYGATTADITAVYEQLAQTIGNAATQAVLTPALRMVKQSDPSIGYNVTLVSGSIQRYTGKDGTTLKDNTNDVTVNPDGSFVWNLGDIGKNKEVMVYKIQLPNVAISQGSYILTGTLTYTDINGNEILQPIVSSDTIDIGTGKIRLRLLYENPANGQFVLIRDVYDWATGLDINRTYSVTAPDMNGYRLHATELSSTKSATPTLSNTAPVIEFKYSYKLNAHSNTDNFTLAGFSPSNEAEINVIYNDYNPITNDLASGISLVASSVIDGTVLKDVSNSSVTAGTIRKSGNKIIFTPAAGYSGTTRFSYTICSSTYPNRTDYYDSSTVTLNVLDTELNNVRYAYYSSGWKAVPATNAISGKTTGVYLAGSFSFPQPAVGDIVNITGVGATATKSGVTMSGSYSPVVVNPADETASVTYRSGETPVNLPGTYNAAGYDLTKTYYALLHVAKANNQFVKLTSVSARIDVSTDTVFMQRGVATNYTPVSSFVAQYTPGTIGVTVKASSIPLS